MPVDPVLADLLAAFPPPDPDVSVEDMRALSNALLAPAAGGQDVEVRDLTVDGADGPLGARLYRPPAAGTPGLVVFLHGGGWVIGSLDSHDGVCRDLAAGSGAAVLAVDYRLAPEHPFPAAVEDAWAALQWAHRHADELGADGDRMAVAGDSAGGNLAAVTALMARDAGLALRLQLLVYPATDFSRHRPSRRENGEGYLLTEQDMVWFEGHYRPDPMDWRASPLLAPDHAHVAPAAVLTCEFDPLRDEGNEYAAVLAAAGVPVTARCYEGLIHASFNLYPMVPAARVMMDDACRAVAAALR